MTKIKDVTILLLFVAMVILLLLRQCGGPKPSESVLKPKQTTITVNHTDTVYPEPKIIRDTIYLGKPTTSVKTDPVICDKINTYHDSLVDSNIVITNTLIALGELKMNEITYKLKVPVRITKTITNTITNTITKEIYRMPCISTSIGLGIGGNKNQLSSIMPYVGVRINKTYVDAGYNLMDQTVNIRVGINLFNIK